MSETRFILMLLIMLLLCRPVAAQALVYDRRDEVVGHILLQLPHYMFWDEPNESQSLCIIGAPNFYTRLSDLNNKTKVFSNVYSFVDEIGVNCNYVYVPQPAKARQLLSKGLPRRSLLISSYQSFINEGGPIAIVDDDGQIDIYLNLTAVKNQSFHLSPDLIELSKRVIQ